MWERRTVVTSRTTILGAFAAAFALGACAAKPPPPPDPQIAARAAVSARERQIEDAQDQIIRQLAICESGGYGPSERPIYGARGLYHGRLQFAPRTVIAYVKQRDGVQLTLKQASELAHDYDRAASLAKYMIFDLNEPQHWPLCSRKIRMPQQMAAIQKI